MESILQDLHYGVRLLRKNPAFTLIAAIALALGIAANSAVFSLINALLLKPLPFDWIATCSGVKPGDGKCTFWNCSRWNTWFLLAFFPF
jgi:hypothetical protein